MKELPEAETYEEGLEYWPYKTSLLTVIEYICEHAPQNGKLLDVMCGPGYLFGKIKEKRPDLSLYGVDIDERYIEHGNKTYSGVHFEQGDVLTWRPEEKFDVVVCTGSVHHIPYELQEQAIANIASMASPAGLVIISDCYVDDYSDETERKQAAAKLGYEYIRETIANGGSERVISWTIDILSNDVLMHEFKPSYEKRLPLLEKCFGKVTTIKTWPNANPPGYGDYIHICEVR
ncbi:MAG: class SAM-dependent methyltransferase [Parcubacteria group bacterium]|nr:class SAM-dependent methyltransferase [Parcubacteria group bacterium]